MTLSVRMNPLLEKELETAARKKGVTKSQFVIDAVERALGRKNPYELMLKMIAEEDARTPLAVKEAFADYEQPYDTEKSRELLLKKLRAKHGVGGAG